MMVIAPTDYGKTTLIRELLQRDTRPTPWIAFLSSKRRDDTIEEFHDKLGFHVTREWAVPDADICPRVLLAPRLADFDKVDKARRIFFHALNSMYRQGGWTIVLDEFRYFTETIGLKPQCELLLQQGRSEGLTLVMGAQRPRHVPLLAYDQSKHIFLGFDNDLGNVKRLAEIGGGLDAKQAAVYLASLRNHEFLYVNTRPPVTTQRVMVEL